MHAFINTQDQHRPSSYTEHTPSVGPYICGREPVLRGMHTTVQHERHDEQGKGNDSCNLTLHDAVTMLVDNQHRLKILLRAPVWRGSALHTKQKTLATEKRSLNLAEKENSGCNIVINHYDITTEGEFKRCFTICACVLQNKPKNRH